MAQFARPTSDVSTGSWATAPLWSKIDDDLAVTPTGDGSVITSDAVGNNSDTSIFEVALSAVADPGVGTGHVIRVRCRTTGNAMTMTVALFQGAAQRSTDTSATLSGTESEVTFTLSGAEADSITDYGDLRFRINGRGTAGGPGRSLEIESAELEVPDAPIPAITSIDTDNDTVDTRTGVVVAGSNFGASETGSAKVEVSNNATYGAGTVVEVDVTSWSATSITVTLRRESDASTLNALFTLPLNPAYLWVTDSAGARNATGFEFILRAAGPTAVAAVNTNATLDADATYLLRVRVESSGVTGATGFRWSYNHEAAGWTPVTTTSTHIKAVAADSYDNDADVPELLGGAGSYLADNNAATEDGTTTLGAAFPASGAVEFLLAFQIDGAEVSDEDTGQIRLELGDGTDLDTYTNTFTYTVNVQAVSGTASGTLTTATASATGTATAPEVTGTAAATLAVATGSATGALTISGTAAGTLSAATGAAQGELTIAGAAAGTLAAATASATGALTIAGTTAGTLQSATGTAAGWAEATGTASATLAAATGSATGQLVISGTAAGTLAAATASATGVFGAAGVTGTAAGTLAAATGAATGELTIAGTADGSLQAATAAATGIVEAQGTAAATLAAATASAVAELTIAGSAAGFLAAATGEASGTFFAGISGTAEATLRPATGAASGWVEAQGDATGILAAATASASGTAEIGEVTGEAAAVLAAASGQASGELRLEGDAAGTLQPATASASGNVAQFQGAAAALLSAAAASATGGLEISGSAAGLTAAATGAATGAAQVTGAGTAVLRVITGDATGVNSTGIPVPAGRIIPVAARQSIAVPTRGGAVAVLRRGPVVVEAGDRVIKVPPRAA